MYYTTAYMYVCTYIHTYIARMGSYVSVTVYA